MIKQTSSIQRTLLWLSVVLVVCVIAYVAFISTFEIFESPKRTTLDSVTYRKEKIDALLYWVEGNATTQPALQVVVSPQPGTDRDQTETIIFSAEVDSAQLTETRISHFWNDTLEIKYRSSDHVLNRLKKVDFQDPPFTLHIKYVLIDSLEKKWAEKEKRLHATIVEKLGLEPIEDSTDSLQIRIWYWHPFGTWCKLLRLSYGNKWTSAEIIGEIDFELFVRSKRDSVEIHHKRQRKITPVHGWDPFINGLLKNDLLTLPTMDSIPNLEDGVLDGVSYEVEIVKKGAYRAYRYHAPSSFEEFPEAKKMVSILVLIEKELGIHWETF